MTPADFQLGFDLGAGEPPHNGGVPARQDAPSEEQRAILAFERDLVVTAGAGSGKTRTLVDLYAGILAEPGRIGSAEVRPAEILCLTFTERAAREIQARIRESVDDPALLRELESAPIGTFHGWCAALLRDHPLEAGIDPRFTVLSEDAAGDLLFGAAIETLRHGLETGDPPARIAVEILGLYRAARKLADLVRELRTAGWSERQPIERFEARVAEAAVEAAGPLAEAVDVAAAAVLDAVRGAFSTPLARTYIRQFEAAHERWRSERSAAAADSLETAAKEPAHSWRGTKEVRNSVIDAIEAWRGARREVDHALQLGAWPALAVSVRVAYRAARTARAALDYDDLLLRSRDLLKGHAEILETVRGRHQVILVDEHQDTDPVQHEILELLLGVALRGEGAGPRWCVVGDARQSIYGFRGATVEAFAQLARAALARGTHRTLACNYRSRPELIAFHNAFFPRLLTGGPDAVALAYVAQHAWRPDAPGPAVELLAAEPDGRPAIDVREDEARALAARIRAACDPADSGAVEVWDRKAGAWRVARPGDVTILMRKLTQVEPYRRALQSVGIETVVTGSGEFYGRQEVFDVLNALEAALAPEDPVPLVGFLRSPMVGLADDALWRLARGWDRKRRLAAHLAANADAGAVEPEQAERLAQASAILDELRARADTQPPGTVVAWLVDRTGYAAVLDAVPDREQRRANLERLVALADRAPAEGAGLLADWTAALRRRVENPPRDRDASPPEAGDRVLILSIHQAKGLEFPVVALADVGGSTQQGGAVGVEFDRQLGVVARWWEDPATPGVPTRSYTLAAAARKERERAEEARLLYVAATRARDRLIISAGVRTSEGWWLPALLEFAQDQQTPHLALDSLERWRELHSTLAQVAPPLPEPGTPRLEPLAAAPGEITARELAAALAEQREPPRVAGIGESMRLRMRRGERAHRVLELLPLGPPAGFELLSWLEAGGVAEPDLASVSGFVENELWPRLGAAAEVHREMPFRLRLPAPGGMVVGTIDCLWRAPDGGWWVWDYKLASDETPESRHEAQLSIYALAASAALGVHEVRGALWYLESGRAREFHWDRNALEEAEARLAAAFAFAPTIVDDDDESDISFGH